MKIEVLHQQSLFTVNEESVTRYASWIMTQVSKLAPDFNWQELSILFTDDQIRKLNFEWFGKDTVTDVISFAYPAVESTGEIIVNLQQAYEEGLLRQNPDQELALYIAHGCHHLMGAEDNTPARKKAMLDLEQQWVSDAFSCHNHGPFFI